MNGNLQVVESVDYAPSLNSDTIIELAEYAEKRVEAIKKIRAAAISLTNKNDWVDQNGRPYLQASGAEKLRFQFGASWRIDEPVFEKDEDGHFSYTYKGIFSLRDASIEVIGVRSSRDPFFSKRKGGTLPPSEIGRGDVKKAAYTNCIGNGITRLLGIRNLTWEELAATGIKQTDAARVDYKNDAKKINDIAQQLGNEILAFVNGDKDSARSVLVELTTWTDKDGKEHAGKSSLYDISEKMAGVAIGKLRKMIEADERAAIQ